MSSHKRRSHPKKKYLGHSRRHRRKRNLEKKWNPKHFLEPKIFQREKQEPFHILTSLYRKSYIARTPTSRAPTSYTSFPIQPYNNQE